MSNRILIRSFKKKMCYELMHGRPPKVSHFRVFGCRCFILKKGKQLDKFESRSSDGIFLGYAIHSRAYRVLNLETIQVMETCKVTFDETMPCNSAVFECAGNEEMADTLFVEEKDEEGEDDGDQVHGGDQEPPTSTTTVTGGPTPTPTTTHLGETRVEARVEGEVTSRSEAPRQVQVDHPPSKIIGDIDEHTTRSRS